VQTVLMGEETAVLKATIHMIPQPKLSGICG